MKWTKHFSVAKAVTLCHAVTRFMPLCLTLICLCFCHICAAVHCWEKVRDQSLKYTHRHTSTTQFYGRVCVHCVWTCIFMWFLAFVFFFLFKFCGDFSRLFNRSTWFKSHTWNNNWGCILLQHEHQLGQINCAGFVLHEQQAVIHTARVEKFLLVKKCGNPKKWWHTIREFCLRTSASYLSYPASLLLLCLTVQFCLSASGRRLKQHSLHLIYVHTFAPYLCCGFWIMWKACHANVWDADGLRKLLLRRTPLRRRRSPLIKARSCFLPP